MSDWLNKLHKEGALRACGRVPSFLPHLTIHDVTISLPGFYEYDCCARRETIGNLVGHGLAGVGERCRNKLSGPRKGHRLRNVRRTVKFAKPHVHLDLE